jgi:hypothetical protein
MSFFRQLTADNCSNALCDNYTTIIHHDKNIFTTFSNTAFRHPVVTGGGRLVLGRSLRNILECDKNISNALHYCDSNNYIKKPTLNASIEQQ